MVKADDSKHSFAKEDNLTLRQYFDYLSNDLIVQIVRILKDDRSLRKIYNRFGTQMDERGTNELLAFSIDPKTSLLQSDLSPVDNPKQPLGVLFLDFITGMLEAEDG